MPDTGSISQSVRKSKVPVGYVGHAYVNPYGKAVAVSYDGGEKFVTPSIESAIRKEYPVVRPLYYYYDKANEKAVQPFLEYLDTPQAREKTLDLGFIPR